MDSAYVKKNHQSLMYHKNLNLLDSIVERRCERYWPQSNRNGLTAGSQLEFTINNDQFLDLTSATLNFQLTFSDLSSFISNAADAFQRLDVFYNDVLIETVDDCNSWCNAFLSSTSSLNYIQTEGESLLGYYGPKNCPPLTDVSGRNYNQTRYYSVPLMLLSGLARSNVYTPILGNRLRFVFRTASNGAVISRPGSSASTYTINDVSMLCDTIIVKSEYRKKIMDVIASPGGLKIPFTSYSTSRLAVYKSTEQNLKLSFNLSNALSLHMLYDNINSGAKESMVANTWNLSRQSFPLSNFNSWIVRSGSQYFTPNSGIQGFHENYRNIELATSSLLNLSGTGFIDYNLMTSPYSKTTATPDTNGRYGMCLLSVNLSKSINNDDASIVNEGLSSSMNGASNEIDINLKTNAELSETDVWLVNIVHRRVLSFENSSVQCMF